MDGLILRALQNKMEIKFSFDQTSTKIFWGYTRHFQNFSRWGFSKEGFIFEKINFFGPPCEFSTNLTSFAVLVWYTWVPILRFFGWKLIFENYNSKHFYNVPIESLWYLGAFTRLWSHVKVLKRDFQLIWDQNLP